MIAPLAAVRLRKAAFDSGFDLEDTCVGDWLAFRSTKVPLRVWLSGGDAISVALSDAGVARELEGEGQQTALASPFGAVTAFHALDYEDLHHILRRAFRLSLALPDQPLHEFERQTLDLPRTTEVERLVVQRIGQDIYRRGLVEYWEGRCAISGLDISVLLRASHSKPWADCRDDAERLDVFNGFLLAVHLDALFDRGFITIGDDAKIELSPVLPVSAIEQLRLRVPMCVSRLTDNHRHYLAWHRARVFRVTPSTMGDTAVDNADNTTTS